MGWWSNNNMRLIQNNFIDPNAAMDVKQWVQDLKSFDCTVALVGVGGITSFFPTTLEYQVVSPYLPEGRDLIREIIDECHAEGIRVMGRFDFGRAHEKFFESNPEWFYRSRNGKLLRCADTITTCICGYYQQEYSKKILQEALERYTDIDGIFFNAFGFAGWDYYGNQFGPCHCVNCQKKFREFSGMSIPNSEQDSAMPAYKEFQRKVIAEALRDIQELIRSYNPSICLSTYSPDGVDIIKSESNSGVGRPLPFPLMNSSYNIAAARHTWPNQPMGNCVINATDLRWRYSAVSPYLTQIRLYQNIAAGGYLDFCINGIFSDYPDQASLEPVREVFHYHKRNEKYYGQLKSQAKLVLVRTEGSRPIHDGSAELFGIMKALKEEHILFDLQSEHNLLENPLLLEKYECILIPDINDVSDELLRLMKKCGKPVVISAVNTPISSERSALLDLSMERIETDNAGAYLETRQKNIFLHFEKKDWVFITDPVGLPNAPQYTSLLPYVEKGNFGPAERAYGNKTTNLGTILRKDNLTLITWSLGKLYQLHGYQDHKYILADLLDLISPNVRVITTDAHPSVELFWDETENGMLLQALNLSGFNGTTIEAPITMKDVTVTVPYKAAEIASLNDTPIHFTATSEGTAITFEELSLFEAVYLKCNDCEN